MKRVLLFLFTAFMLTAAHASGLDEKLSLARYLLQQQTPAESLKDQTRFGYMLAENGPLGFSLKNSSGETVRAYIHQNSMRIFFVEFYETGSSSKDLQTYFTNLKYVWVGTEKGCDYLNNGELAVSICPPSATGFRICINLMPH